MLGVIEKLVSRRQLFLRTKAYNLNQSLKARDIAAVSCSWLTLPSKIKVLSLADSSSSSSISNPASLSFCRNISHTVFSQSSMSLSSVGVAASKEKVDSVVKRGRQAKNRRNNNRARKSLIKTRTKKALEALESLKNKKDAQPEEILPIEKLIREAYSVIDKAVRVGTMHRNMGERRKSRLARSKKLVEIHHGWYTPGSEGSV